MKKLFFISLLACAACTAPKPEQELTIVTYNVHHCEGIDTVTDYGRIGRFIASQKPDFVAIQEVDSATTRSDGNIALAEIASAAGMEYTFAKAIDFAGGAYGIGILSHEKPLDVTRIALPGREEERVLLVAEFPDCVFACTHLSLTEADRIASVPLIAAELEKTDKPFIICGDWNDTPSSAALKAMGEYFTIVSDTVACTYPSDVPQMCIDYVAVANADVASHEATVHAGRVESDHLPQTVRVSLK